MKAIKIKSRKAKGKRLEAKVAGLIRSKLKIRADRMPMSGAIDGFKSDIYSPDLPLTIECKNSEKVKLWEFWEQAKGQEKPFKPACLVVSGNDRPILAVLEIDELLNLVKESSTLQKH